MAPTLRDRLGGRWALSWQASILGSALIVVLFVSQGAAMSQREESSGGVAVWLGVALIAVTAKSLWQLVANATFLRHRRERPLPVFGVIAFDMGTGLVFGATALAGEALLGASAAELTPRSAIIRAVAFAVSALWWYLITTLAFDSIDRFAHERRNLVARLVEWQGMLLREEQVEDELRASVAGELSEPVQRTRSVALAALARSDDDVRAVSDDLRDLAGTSVRTLSHDLMERADREYPRSDLRTALPVVLREHRFAVWPMAALVLLVLLPSGASGPASGVGLVGVLGAALATAGLLAAVNLVMDRTRMDTRWVSVVALVLLQGLTLTALVVLTRAASPAGGGDASTPSAVALIGTVVAITLGVIVTSLLKALHTHRSRVLNRLRIDSDEARAEQTVMSLRLATATRKVASELHGSLQTRLMTCAGALDSAVDAGDPAAIDEALTRVLEVLADPLADPEMSGERAERLSLMESVSRPVREWEGILDVRVFIDPEVTGEDDDLASAATVVVEEALANSYRHGHASSVTIDVTRVDDGILITVEDDGTGLGANPPGLGVRRMQSVSRFGIEALPVGTRVTARITRSR